VRVGRHTVVVLLRHTSRLWILSRKIAHQIWKFCTGGACTGVHKPTQVCTAFIPVFSFLSVSYKSFLSLHSRAHMSIFILYLFLVCRKEKYSFLVSFLCGSNNNLFAQAQKGINSPLISNIYIRRNIVPHPFCVSDFRH
jgi:hypothetical protein